MDFEFVKVVVFVPATHAAIVRKTLAEAGAGKMGNYDSCSFSSKGIGRFRPLKGSNPFVGELEKMEEVEEERIELICSAALKEKVLQAVRGVHPYEEPAIDMYPLLNL